MIIGSLVFLLKLFFLVFPITGLEHGRVSSYGIVTAGLLILLSIIFYWNKICYSTKMYRTLKTIVVVVFYFTDITVIAA